MNRPLIASILILALLAGGFWAFVGRGASPDGFDEVSRLGNPSGTAAHRELADPAAGRSPAAGNREDAESRVSRVATTDDHITARGRLCSGESPLANVEVRLRVGLRSADEVFPFWLPAGTSETKAQTTRSGPDGRFRFHIPASQGGRLLLRDPSWVLAKGVTFDGSLADIELGDVECLEAASVSGRVHEGGRPVAKADVTVYGYGNGYFQESTKTDEDGRFELKGLRPGKCRWLCSTGRHLTRRDVLELAPAERRTGLAIELAAGMSLAGQVLDDLCRPLAGVSIRAKGRYKSADGTSRKTLARTESDRAGFFTLNGLAGDKVNVLASGEGYRSARRKGVPLGRTPLLLRLTRLGSLSGVLVSWTGEPFDGSTVRARRDSKGQADSSDLGSALTDLLTGPEAVTDAKGRFTIEGIEPGPVQVVATGKHRAATLGGLVVRPGERTSGIRMQADRGVAVEVTVLDPSGAPVKSATVTVSPVRKKGKQGSEEAPAAGDIRDTADLSLLVPGLSPWGRKHLTDTEGRVTVWGLEPRVVVIEADEPRWVEARTEPMRLPAEGRLPVQLCLRRGGHVELHTVDAQGKPVGHLSLRIAPAKGGRSTHGKTDAAGKLRLGPFAPGAYVASLQKRSEYLSGAYAIPAARLDGGGPARPGGDENGVGFDVSAGETTQVRLVRPAPVSITGTVRDKHGPVAAAQIWLLRLDRRRAVRHKTSAADGSFRFADLDPGRYQVRYLRKNGAVPHLKELLVRKGQQEQTVQLLIQGSELVVRVRSGERPVAGARLSLRQVGSRGLTRSSWSVDAGSPRLTDATGKAVIPEIPEGTYSLVVDHDDYARRTLPDIEVQDGRRLQEVALARAGRISVRATGLDGQPAASFNVFYRRNGETRWRKARGRKGRAELLRLEPGVYEIRARMRGRGTRPWSVTVNAKAEVEQSAEVELRIPG